MEWIALFASLKGVREGKSEEGGGLMLEYVVEVTIHHKSVSPW